MGRVRGGEGVGRVRGGEGVGRVRGGEAGEGGKVQLAVLFNVRIKTKSKSNTIQCNSCHAGFIPPHPCTYPGVSPTGKKTGQLDGSTPSVSFSTVTSPHRETGSLDAPPTAPPRLPPTHAHLTKCVGESSAIMGSPSTDMMLSNMFRYSPRRWRWSASETCSGCWARRRRAARIEECVLRAGQGRAGQGRAGQGKSWRLTLCFTQIHAFTRF